MKPLSEYKVGDYVRPAFRPDVVWRISALTKDQAMVREFWVITVSTGDGFEYWIGPIMVSNDLKATPTENPEMGR